MFVARLAFVSTLAVALPGIVACSHPHTHPHPDAAEPEAASWAVTAWGQIYEVFPEIDPLIAGSVASAHTHVTELAGFRALTAGRVEIVLRRDDGSEEVFLATEVVRPGIFNIDITPTAPGERELLFRIDAPGGREEIRGGRVRVGTSGAPGGLAAEPAAEGEVSFLKEQQWKTAFATVWAETGTLRQALVGPGTVVPRAGGDQVLTAPVAGRLEGRPWPHVGLAAGAGRVLFQIVPRLDPDVSFAALESQVATLEAELVPVVSRLARLEKLAQAGAVATEEVETARGERAALEARLAGARRDLEAAQGARSGQPRSGDRIALKAPFAGALASVLVTPGQNVEAGQELGRFVATDQLWIAAALPSAEATGLVAGPIDLSLQLGADRNLGLPPGSARLVARAPAVDPATGRLEVLIELPPNFADLSIGLAVEVELAAGPELPGVVLPTAALVDDAGVAVVYIQNSGESFTRREVRVLARRGDRLLVTGIEAGERVVTLGGGAIRRSTLVGSGVGEAHVH
ncbi:MAG: efflux RND transporter periplasmic adaptor subunit [Thermoanaerobaculia bacterium]|nr:efflux RND transporter periplasmic adaptor subunit [Thermoanaerobaculia bacterium]